MFTACNQWQSVPNQHSINGVPQSGARSVADCQSLCVAASLCVAIDYDSTAQIPCWLHLNAQDLIPDNIYPSNGVVQYILTRVCPSSGNSDRLLSTMCCNALQGENLAGHWRTAVDGAPKNRKCHYKSRQYVLLFFDDLFHSSVSLYYSFITAFHSFYSSF